VAAAGTVTAGGGAGRNDPAVRAAERVAVGTARASDVPRRPAGRRVTAGRDTSASAAAVGGDVVRSGSTDAAGVADGVGR